MRRFTRFTLSLATVAFVIPFSTAQADDMQGGEVPVPPKKAAPPPPPAAPPPPAPAPQPVTAAPPPYVELARTSVAAGIGISWGEGVLSFEGTRHEFSVRGLSLLDVGASAIDGMGEVSNLERIEDFEGTYMAVEAAAAAGVGSSIARMRNEHGVVIRLASHLTGAAVTLGAQGFEIKLR